MARAALTVPKSLVGCKKLVGCSSRNFLQEAPSKTSEENNIILIRFISVIFCVAKLKAYSYAQIPYPRTGIREEVEVLGETAVAAIAGEIGIHFRIIAGVLGMDEQVLYAGIDANLRQLHGVYRSFGNRIAQY